MKQLQLLLVPALLLATVVGLLLFIAAFTLVERKLMGLHQRREGPDRVGFEGLGQPFGDGLKLLRKETLLPKDSPETRLFFLAPLLSLWVSLLLWLLLPLSNGGAFCSSDLGLLLVLGLSGLGSYGVIYAGWASNNKYALLGSFRAVAQFISYEILFSLLFLPLLGTAGSAGLLNLVQYQTSEGWFAYLLPLWLLSFLVVLAETNRTPFDLPEAEAELVAGFNVEYSSLLFAFFFLAEYGAMGFFGTLLAVLFFGGGSWHPGGHRNCTPDATALRLDGIRRGSAALGRRTPGLELADPEANVVGFCALPPLQPDGYRYWDWADTWYSRMGHPLVNPHPARLFELADFSVRLQGELAETLQQPWMGAGAPVRLLELLGRVHPLLAHIVGVDYPLFAAGRGATSLTFGGLGNYLAYRRGVTGAQPGLGGFFEVNLTRPECYLFDS